MFWKKKDKDVKKKEPFLRTLRTISGVLTGVLAVAAIVVGLAAIPFTGGLSSGLIVAAVLLGIASVTFAGMTAAISNDIVRRTQKKKEEQASKVYVVDDTESVKLEKHTKELTRGKENPDSYKSTEPYTITNGLKNKEETHSGIPKDIFHSLERNHSRENMNMTKSDNRESRGKDAGTLFDPRILLQKVRGKSLSRERD